MGDPLSPTNETKRFQPVTTATTILLAKGVYVKLVSEMLGLSTIVLTLDTYSQVIPAMDAIFTVESALAH